MGASPGELAEKVLRKAGSVPCVGLVARPQAVPGQQVIPQLR